MTRKRALICSALVCLVIGGVAVTMLWALVQVPEFYSEALHDIPSPVKRKQAAKTFVQRTMHLVDEIKHADTWSEEFTQEQVNSWLAEELHQKYSDAVPPGVHDPRVQITRGQVRLGFRFSQEGWEGVVSLHVRPALIDSNRLTFEIEAVRAGLIPLPLDGILNEVSDRLKQAGWHTEWKIVDGHEVMIVSLDAHTPDSAILEKLQIGEGFVRVAGSRRKSETPTEPQHGDSAGTPATPEVATDAEPGSETRSAPGDSSPSSRSVPPGQSVERPRISDQRAADGE